MRIGKVEKNSQEEIRVTLQNYQGTDIIDLRTYWKTGEGKWIPTKKGISLTLSVIEDVVKLLKKANKKMREEASVPEESVSGRDLLEIIKRL